MSLQPLMRVLRLLDSQVPSPWRLSPEDFNRADSSQLDVLVAHHMLVLGPPRTTLACAGCDVGCQAEVVWRQTTTGISTPVIVCDGVMKWGDLSVNPSWLTQWETSPALLATVVSQMLYLDRPPDTLIPDRCWWLGTLTGTQGTGHVFLARGTTWVDAPAVFARVGRLHDSMHPIVLTPYDVPEPSPFRVPVTLRSLAGVLHSDGAQLQVCREELDRIVQGSVKVTARELVPFSVPPHTTWEQVQIHFANPEVVRIAIGSTADHRSFADMGFADGRKSVETPDGLWDHFRELAEHDGRIAWSDTISVPRREQYQVKTWIKGLRARLKAFFPEILGDPFLPYQRVHAYATRCVLGCTKGYRRAHC
ncbi:MAG: hypothetical protein ACYDBB_09675 [Armatimonadota bacterium]